MHIEKIYLKCYSERSNNAYPEILYRVHRLRLTEKNRERGAILTEKEVQYVSTIADCCNITKAAELLFIAQPSLTQALQRIEDDYGARFFYRTKCGLQLTDAGKAYLDAASQMQLLYKNMEYEVGDICGAQQGRIDFGITVFQGGVLLPELLPRFQKKYPRVQLNLLEASSAQLEELAADGKLDMAILHRPFRTRNLNYLTLYKEEFYLAVSQDNPDYMKASAGGSDKPVITAEILQNQPIIMQTANQRVRHMADSICAHAKVTPNIEFTTSSFETSLSLASKGMGAAFVSESLARFYSRYEPAYFRFPPEWGARWELVAAYSKNVALPRPCLELFKVLQECIVSMPEVFG